MSDNSNELGAFLAGFVIGGLVGAATALILAPQSGEETRSRLLDKQNEWRNLGQERLQHARETAAAHTQDYRSRAGDALTGARDRVQDASGQVQERARIVLDSGKDRATQVRDQVGGMVQKDDGIDLTSGNKMSSHSEDSAAA